MDNELHFLACCLLDPNLVDTAIIAGCEYDWFTSQLHRKFWKGMIERIAENKDIDIAWGNEYMGTRYMFNLSPAISDILHPRSEVMTIIEILKKRYQRKKFGRTLDDIHKRLYVDHPEKLMNELIEQVAALKRIDKDEGEVNIMTSIIERLNRGLETPAGFSQIDWMTKGIEPAVLWMIGGFSSNGKTTLCLNIAMNLAKKAQPVTIFSTEMLEMLLVMKLATIDSGINPSIMTDITQEQKSAFLNGVDKVQKLPIEICATLSLANIRLHIRKKKSKLYIVDYIQLILPDKPIEDEVKRLGYIARELLALAKEYEVCIIATSQFHRMPRNKDGQQQTPNLSSFRGSGEIEENTDIGILMYYPYQQATFEQQEKLKEQGKENCINFAVQKNRIHGLLGMVKIEFDRKTMRMKEVSRDEE